MSRAVDIQSWSRGPDIAPNSLNFVAIVWPTGAVDLFVDNLWQGNCFDRRTRWETQLLKDAQRVELGRPAFHEGGRHLYKFFMPFL
jgi:hypothetical protein